MLFLLLPPIVFSISSSIFLFDSLNSFIELLVLVIFFSSLSISIIDFSISCLPLYISIQVRMFLYISQIYGTFFSEGKGRWLHDYRDPVTGDGLSAAQWHDLTCFEGNANAFRLLTHQFCGRRAGGFAMTYSMLASIVKYQIGRAHV